MFFEDDTVKKIKENANIVNIIGEYVELKRTGKNFKGLCPFHREKTPSFVVSEEKQFYKCFGCGESGDVLTFIMKRNNMSFAEAVEYLADKLGITIDNTMERRREKIDSEKYYKINEEVRKFYFEMLITNKFARDYLRKRGIEDKYINKFFLGYAPDSWDMLYTHMMRLRYNPKDLEHLGLIGISKNGNYFDKFRNRLMFPIIDIRKRIIGFGGRALGEDYAKYINSPESTIYHKGQHLYALNEIHNSNYRDKIVLVEGYMDVIGLHQKGIDYSVANLGTALTESQAKLCARYGKSVYLCYDSDQAGLQATERAIEIFKNINIYPGIIKLDDGYDPDDYVKQFGKEAFEAKIKNAMNPIDFQTDLIISRYDVNDTVSLGNLVAELGQYLKNIQSEVVRDEYINKIASKLEINPNSFRKDIAKLEMNRPRFVKSEDDSKRDLTLPVLMVDCITFAAADKRYYDELEYYLNSLEKYGLAELRDYINAQYKLGKDRVSVEEMINSLSQRLFTKQLLKDLREKDVPDFDAGGSKVLFELIKRLEYNRLLELREDLKRDISMILALDADEMDMEIKKKLILLMDRLKEIEIELKTGR